MIRALLCSLMVAVLSFSTDATSADLSSLEIGNFNAGFQSAVKPKSVTVKNGPKQLSFALKLNALVANADGSKTENSAGMNGSFVVVQPSNLPLSSMTIELQGHIVKTAGSTATLDITIGGVLKTITWGPDDVVSKVFNIKLNEPIPNGVVPVILPVSAIALVTKNADEGAVLVSLESIKVNLGQLTLAAQ